MKKSWIPLVVLIIAGIGVYYIFFKNGSALYPAASNPITNAPPAAESHASQTPAPSAATVTIKNFAFNPPTLAIKTGTRVTWVNNDSVSHTITSDAGGLLNSGPLAPGQSFSFIFTDAGSVNYHCAIHPTMRGSISAGN